MNNLFFPALDDQGRRVPYDVSDDFDMVFTVDLDAWAPRPALYRLAVEAADATGSRVPSPQEVYAALRARGFPESKRRGVWGFKGLSVPADVPTDRPVPRNGTAAAYYRRHDRSDAAREAVFAARAIRSLGGSPEPAPSPWYIKPWSVEDRALLTHANRRRRRKRY